MAILIIFKSSSITLHSSVVYSRFIYSANTFRYFTSNARKVQEDLILSWVSSNANTKYGTSHQFSNIKSVDDFRAQHPLTRYQHYEKYIDDIYQGQTNVMSPQQPYVLAMTSGTSGLYYLSPALSILVLTYSHDLFHFG